MKRALSERALPQRRPTILPRISAVTSLPELSVQAKSACSCGGQCPKCTASNYGSSPIKTGNANDHYEREADHIADQVMHMPLNTTEMQSDTSGRARLKLSSGHGNAAAAQPLAALGSGKTFPSFERRFFESRFGRDFSQVRLYTGTSAATATKSIHARAFTIKNNIVFGDGEYKPHTDGGKRLLAHELTHVLQQSDPSGGGLPVVQAQFENPPKPPPPPDAECRIDPFMVLKVLSGDKSAALKVINCCVNNIPALGGGCSESVIKGACEIFPELCGDKPDKPGGKEKCPLGFKSPTFGKFIGKCCKEGETRNAKNCCDVTQIASKAIFPGCCPPGTRPSADKKTCEDLPLQPCAPDKAVPWKPGPRRTGCECPPSRQNVEQSLCCPVGEEGSSGVCKPKQQIPVPPQPKKPTAKDIDIGFEKDAPQTWYHPAASFGVSITGDGKQQFNRLVGILETEPDTVVQLEGRASSDKPQNDNSYNFRLSTRRTQLIVSELSKRNIEQTRILDFADKDKVAGCSKMSEGQYACGDVAAETPPNKADRKVTARVFKDEF